MLSVRFTINPNSEDFRHYLDYYFIGMFFNLFLPTTVGGDVTKCYYLSKNDPRQRKAPAIYTVLAERYTGVIVVIWMATITMLFPIAHNVPMGFKLLMITLTLMILFLTPVFPVFWSAFFRKKKWVNTFLEDIKVYWANPDLIFKALCWSLLFHILVIGIHIVIAHAMGLKIPLAFYLILYPMTAIAGFIPCAFNGIGPREGTYIFFLSLVGIKSSDALAFSIFWFGIVLFSSLIGGLFYIKGKHTRPPQEFNMEPEEDMFNLKELVEINEKFESPTI